MTLFFSPSGAEKMVKIWSPETGDFLRNLTGHTQGLSDISWSSDSVYLASASDDTTIRIWDVESVRCTLCSTRSFLRSARYWTKSTIVPRAFRDSRTNY